MNFSSNESSISKKQRTLALQELGNDRGKILKLEFNDPPTIVFCRYNPDTDEYIGEHTILPATKLELLIENSNIKNISAVSTEVVPDQQMYLESIGIPKTEAMHNAEIAGLELNRAIIDTAAKESSGNLLSFIKRIREKLHHLAPYILILGSFQLGRIPVPNTGAYKERGRAQAEMIDKRITAEQANAYKKGLSELIYESYAPHNYLTTLDEWKKAVRENIKPNLAHALDQKTRHTGSSGEVLEDEWRFYLGLKTLFNSIGVSQYRPEHAKEDKYYYKLNHFAANLQDDFSKTQHAIMEMYSKDGFPLPEQRFFITKIGKQNETNGQMQWTGGEEIDYINTYLITMAKYYSSLPSRDQLLIDDISTQIGQDLRTIKSVQAFDRNLGMRNFTISWGEDEKGLSVRYYDKYDLESNFLNEGKLIGVGAPYELYDRIYTYYDTNKQQVVLNESTGEPYNVRWVTEESFKLHNKLPPLPSVPKKHVSKK